MELSDEQKQRILEEEQQRLAEEQYRTQVRLKLQSRTVIASPVPTKSSTLRYVLIALGIVAVVCVGILVGVRRQHSDEADSSPSQAAFGAQERAAEKSEKPSPIAPVTLTTAQIADRATPSVVIVENFNEDGEKAGQGSGYVFSSDGIVITNYHVIRGAKSLAVRIPGQEPYRIDSVVGYEIDHDVAALQLTGSSLPALLTETVEEPKVGDRVVAIGAPLGLESTVSEGIVSALRNAGTMHIIQTGLHLAGFQRRATSERVWEGDWVDHIHCTGRAKPKLRRFGEARLRTSEPQTTDAVGRDVESNAGVGIIG